MGKGIGKLQFEILDRCRSFWNEFPMLSQTTGFELSEERWNGGEFSLLRDRSGETYHHFYAISHGHEFRPKPPLIDLRLLKQRMAKSDPDRRMTCGRYFQASFSAAFSRAVRGLLARGLLERKDGQNSMPIRFVVVHCVPDTATLTRNTSGD